MQKNILWTGREYYSLENCLIDSTVNGSVITSTIVGHYEGEIFKVEYRIRTNRNWETVFFEIESRHGNQIHSVKYEGNGKGNWSHPKERTVQFEGCIDVDIPVTPFTNTLPIRRLKLAENEGQEIQVLYINVFNLQIVPVRQRYTRLSATRYHYQNVPNDFEAIIQVDESGLVVDYPSLFVRTAIQDSKYPFG